MVDAARGGALDASLVDDDLVERVRRVQLVKRTLMDTWDADQLLAAFHGEAGPDRQYPPSERPQRQRERAARGLRAMLSGRCSARPWPQGLKGRIEFLTTRGKAPLPEEIVAGYEALATGLEKAQLARVTCERGDVALLVVPSADGRLRLVDAFNLVRPNIEVNPNEPTMR